MTGCLVAVVPAACKQFTEKFFEQLRELDDIEENLGALLEYEKRYGTNRGIDILRVELKDRFESVKIELKDRLGGIEECTRREAGDIEELLSMKAGL